MHSHDYNQYVHLGDTLEDIYKTLDVPYMPAMTTITTVTILNLSGLWIVGGVMAGLAVVLSAMLLVVLQLSRQRKRNGRKEVKKRAKSITDNFQNAGEMPLA